jgi:xylulokinase
MRLNLEALANTGIQLKRLFATGGGARSAAWLQLKADIYQCEVIPAEDEASCLGASLCAAVGSSGFNSWAEAVAATRHRGTAFTPYPRNVDLYSESFQRYCELRDRLYGDAGRSLKGVSAP